MSSGFVTETEAAEARQRRQEEWEKVRTPEQPLERPEEPYDGRSLFDRLKEQKMAKDMEYEEAHKLKNLIRGLDDDEVQFLELVDKTKMDAEKKQMQEEEQELKDFRSRVATLQEESEDKKIQSEIKQTKAKSSTLATTAARPTQKSLLGIGIKRKANGDTSNGASSSAKIAAIAATTSAGAAATTNEKVAVTVETNGKNKKLQNIATNHFDRGELKCIAILPGIGPYTESSDSEMSTGSEEEPNDSNCGRYDLVGRKREKKKHCMDD